MKKTAPPKFSINSLNKATDRHAAALMDQIVERSTWLAHGAVAARPFRNESELGNWLEAEVFGLSRDKAVEFLGAHPELSPPHPTKLTPASQSEQHRLHLLDPDPDLAVRLSDLNRRYMQRHGYPFVIALHAQGNMADVLGQFESRLASDPEEELVRSLGEAVSVMRARLARTVDDSSSLAREPIADVDRGTAR